MYARFSDIRNLDAIDRDEAPLGTLYDLYLDTRDWRSAYVVLETGNWLLSQRILIDPTSAGRLDGDSRTLRSTLTRADIENAPPDASVQTVGQQSGGMRLPFGAGPFLLGAGNTLVPTGITQPLGVVADPESLPVSEEERHLRSARELLGYHVHGSDDDVGSVDDVLIDPDDWSAPFLAIDTGHWLPGKRVVIAPRWATSISWEQRRIDIELTRERVEASPPLEDLDGLDRRYASQLSDFYRF